MALHHADGAFIGEAVSKEGRRHNDCQNTEGLEQLCRLQAVILMGSHNGGVRHDPAQVKGRIAQDKIKMRLGLIVPNVTLYDVCLRVELSGNSAGIGIDLTSVGSILVRQKIEEISHAAGEICYQICVGEAQGRNDHFAQGRRCEKLAVFQLLFRRAECVVVFIVAAPQPMQAAISGIAIENILVGHTGLLTGFALQQAENLLIQLSALLLRPSFRVIFVFHIQNHILFVNGGRTPKNGILPLKCMESRSIQRMKRRNDPQPHLRGAVCAGNIAPAFLCGVSVDFLDAAAVQTEPHENMGPIRLFSQFDRHC